MDEEAARRAGPRRGAGEPGADGGREDPWPRGCRLCVLLNPAAGSAPPSSRLRRALAALPGASVRATARPGDVARLARAAEAAECRRLVVAGGDGTLHHVAGALRDPGSGPCVGVVPTGTGNDFARALGLPRDPSAAAAVAAEAPPRRVDAIRYRVGDASGLAVNFVLGGVGGGIARHVTSERKRRWRRLAYLRGLVDELRDVRPRDVVVEADGTAVSSGPHLAVLVANGPTVGSGIPAAPPAEVDDGRLDVVAVRGTSVAGAAGILVRLAAGRHLDSARVTWRRARRIDVRGGGMPFNADGEPVGEGPGTFRIRPGILRVAGPPRRTP